MSSGNDWPLILRTGFGNVFRLGRWDYKAITLLAAAINSDDWTAVEDWAVTSDWDVLTAC